VRIEPVTKRVCDQERQSVDREITESNEVQQLRVQLYRVHGKDYRRSVSNTADGSNCKIKNCISERASVQ
jgi:hypothetical protein